MVEVVVRSRVSGGDAMSDVLVRLEEERTTARELIRRAVEEQVRALRGGRSRRRVFDRQYLSDDEIREQAVTGAVRLPASGPDGVPDVDVAVARAHRAFRKRVFTIVTGGRQVEELDEPLVVRLGEPVVFLRLVALAGG